MDCTQYNECSIYKNVSWRYKSSQSWSWYASALCLIDVFSNLLGMIFYNGWYSMMVVVHISTLGGGLNIKPNIFEYTVE